MPDPEPIVPVIPPTPTAPIPAATTEPVIVPPAADPALATKPSIVGASASDWKEYVPDPAKTAEDNAKLKTAHDATKPAPAADPAKKPDPVVALDFAKDVKLPAGFQIDEKASKSFTDILNDSTLTRAQLAQKLVDLQAETISGLAATRKTAWDNLQTDWQSKVQADPDVGGAKLPGVQANIAYLLDTYGDREVRAVFDLTGAGNQLSVVKWLNKIGAKLREGGPVLGNPPGGKGADAQALYDKTTLNP